ncbi:glycosyltransferase family 39 protein [Hymenobacter sp. BT507]|uniref:Glycosyltransferase family 39 protein n=1 Tax=Hymenobacter citatus TaxID=2763506 RepID=A0ABR7MPW0_9BACT|nr:glycosyltransferase family 39 protein [Hymenobacter citatus]MBC6612568.1 glycosyltransferase family 39 protein [Hymenobacter citatus]
MLLQKKYYALLLLVLLVGFAATLYHRIVHFDDAWCTEQSYWLLKDGIVRSELFRGYNYWHERLYVFHKAFVYVQVPVLYLFGPTIWAARTVPMLFTAVGLVLLLVYFRGRAAQQWLAALFYVGCGCLWTFGVDNRPETMVAACGFASFLLLQQHSARTRWVVVAGAFAGLAALTHLNGTIYIAAGCAWLAGQGHWKKAVWFGLAGGIVLSLYVADALWDNQLNRLLYQFSHDHAAQGNFNWAKKMHVMRRYDQIFFHSSGEVPLTVLFLLTVLVLTLRPATRRLLTPTMQYLLWLLGIFWLLTKNTNVYYYLLFVPILIVVVTELLAAATPHLARWQRLALLVVLCLYPLGAAVRTVELVIENQREPSIMDTNRTLAQYMPRKGAKVIAPIDFFFGQMPHYRVRSLTYYQLIAPDNPPPLTTFFRRAAQDSVRYIICDYRQKNQVYHIPSDAPAQIGAYRRVYQDAWRGIYAYTE